MSAPDTTALLLASAFLDSTPERLAALRACADRGAPPGLVASLELHGILPLAARNLRAAGATLPADVARALGEREQVLREEGLRNALTVERLLAAAERAGVEVTLLKGASLALDVYADPLLRSQGDVDVLVDQRDVRALLRAAVEAGLVEAEGALPLWWHRSTHFHVKLAPALALLKEVEVHWRLHHPALLLCVAPEALRARRVAVSAGKRRAFSLDPLDRFLHLVTHLASHWVRLPAEPDGALLAAWLGAERPRVRLKWLVDLAALAERLAVTTEPAALAERADEWGARRQLAFVARTLRGALAPSPAADRLLAEVLGAVGGEQRPPGARPPARGPGARATAGTRPLAGLDFRREALALWPRWLWPPADHWVARLPGASAPVRSARRVAHAAAVLVRSAGALVLYPLALAARALLRPRRRRARALALAPERVLDVAAAWQALRAAAARAGPAGT